MADEKPKITSPAVNATVSAAVGVTVSGTADPGDMVQVRILSPLDCIPVRMLPDAAVIGGFRPHADDVKNIDRHTITLPDGNWSLTIPPPLDVSAVAIRARVLAVNDESPWTTRPINMTP